MAVPAIAVSGLRKSFGGVAAALDGVDFAVPAGGVLALLGPNGAGKTTVVRILSTLVRPDGGTVRIGGHDVVSGAAAVRALIGVAGQVPAVDGCLTGVGNLVLMGRLRRLGRSAARRRAAELVALFRLGDAARRPAATYSGGLRRRLDLAMTLVGDPRVLLLDEPTGGLDPQARREVWGIVRGLARGGVTVLLTTRHLGEADQLADRVALLDRGRVVAAGTPAELRRLVPGGHVSLRFADRVTLAAAAGIFAGSTPDEGSLTLRIPGLAGPRSVHAVLDRLDLFGLDAEAVDVRAPELDDVVLALTGAG